MENEEAIIKKYPKKVTCNFYKSKSGIYKVNYQNLATKLWDTYYAEYKKLNKLGFCNLIETSIKIPAEVGKYLDVGVFVLDGEVELEDFIADTTPYRMSYVEPKYTESAGWGRLPGHVWNFELKE